MVPLKYKYCIILILRISIAKYSFPLDFVHVLLYQKLVIAPIRKIGVNEFKENENIKTKLQKRKNEKY